MVSKLRIIWKQTVGDTGTAADGYAGLGLDASALTTTPDYSKKKKKKKLGKRQGKRAPPQDESEAAVRIQAVHRGRQARRKLNRKTKVMKGRTTIGKQQQQGQEVSGHL